MAIPVANFTFITNSLSIFLKDKSTENPTTWSWEFGDGNVSNVQNPTHTYAADGDYTVSLVATNADGASEAYEYAVSVNEANDISIDEIISFELPASITLDQNTKNYLIKKWRLCLQAAFSILDEYLGDESKYSQLQNILIAKLVVYDLIIAEARKYMASSLNGGGNSSGGSAGGNIKKIETGPSSAEWYSGSQTLSALFTPNSKGVSIFDELTYDICMLGQKLKVKLPMCKLYDLDPITPLKTDHQHYITSHTYLTNNYGN